MKTPPDRSGIVFEVGAQLEARDCHKKWYVATIRKIDYDKERILVHYQQWSHRHDEWFQWSSPYLRPLERVSLRRLRLNPPCSEPVFVSGTKVLACWTDCRFYPAKILSVNRDDSYTVRFFDGVVQTVKPTKVKPFQEKSKPERSAVGSEGWEEGESEEEGGGVEKQEVVKKKKEEEKKAELIEKVTSEEKEGIDDEENERKRKAELSSSHLPTKKKVDERGGSGMQFEPVKFDTACPTLPNVGHIDRDVLLERQIHLPTTHKFSREPLYRVIKNQPPPILSIELDHNPFKCPTAGCTKSFRKASLLHYHIKYYHSDQQMNEHIGEQEPPRRKRSSFKEGNFVQDMKSEDQNNTCHRDNSEHNVVGTAEIKKDGGMEQTGQDRKDRKNFLRVKLKKKKKMKKKKKKKRIQSGLSSDDEISDKPLITLKLSAELQNTLSQVDDGSDWSTLTAESGEDTPSWPIAMETEECEVVRCVCEVDEENDFMIQCESCLCWQHGTCMGLYEESVPHNYICYYCRHTAGWRQAQRFLSEPDMLISGHMFGLSCVKENYSQINSSKILHTNRLLAHVHGLTQVLSGLQLQIGLLHSPSHPDLKLWRVPWRREESQLCYVSSEHCYPIPGASWEKSEEGQEHGAAVKDEQNPEMEEVKREDFTKTLADVSTDTNVVPNSAVKTENEALAYSHKRVRVQTAMQEPREASVAECRMNLLEHVEALHHQISSRMDMIERELDVLESWLDHSGELEPPDPLSRLPQLKQQIRWLLHDLCTVRRLSFWR